MFVYILYACIILAYMCALALECTLIDSPLGKSINCRVELKQMELLGLRAQWEQPSFPLSPCPQIIFMLQYVTMQALTHKDTHRHTMTGMHNRKSHVIE